ncbi:MAG: prepilin-type N-terminal cleavage/methylation domain-containing protein [Zetaproteobacteria bacterium]|nr:MAG: prepilin-type N-terminal cleavage/methylation domain-containing protein [Zetaproteobacteria bacterium]
MLMRERGFTLVELLVAMAIALVVLGGLVLAFRAQYGTYKWQNRQADAVQDMEAVLHLIKQDIENSLIVAGSPKITIVPDPATNPTAATTDLRIELWEPDASFWGGNAAAYKYRAERHYQFDSAAKSLRLDRNTRDGNDAPKEILGNVTWFQVWTGSPPAGTSDGPPADPYGMRVWDEDGHVIASPAYTVLLEVEVPVGTRGARKRDVFGNPTTAPRVHRYLRAYPKAAVSQ